MRWARAIIGFLWPLAWLAGCGQESLILPGGKEVSLCGDSYPGGGGDGEDGGDPYGIEVGEIFPCVVFESARLAGQDTYINIPDVYLEAKHNEANHRAIVFVISASNCPGCAVLIEEMVSEADAFDEAGAFMIGVAWCNNLDLEDCDFDLNTADSVLENEGWPIERWPITNDSESHLRLDFGEVYPTVVVVEIAGMRVRAIERAPDAETVLSLVRSF